MGTFYWWIFEDGYRVCAMGFDEIEMSRLTLTHGALIEKVRA
jgi:hypothetical protein